MRLDWLVSLCDSIPAGRLLTQTSQSARVIGVQQQKKIKINPVEARMVATSSTHRCAKRVETSTLMDAPTREGGGWCRRRQMPGSAETHKIIAKLGLPLRSQLGHLRSLFLFSLVRLRLRRGGGSLLRHGLGTRRDSYLLWHGLGARCAGVEHFLLRRGHCARKSSLVGPDTG